MRKELWYETLGYAYNPFTIKPGFFDDEVVGYDKEIDKVVDLLDEGNMVFLEGEFGQGKTTILKYLINEFRGQSRIVYISRNRNDRAFNYGSLLKGANKGLGKLFGLKAKNAILIVDETEKINAKDCEQIIDYFENGNFKSVLFVDKSIEQARLSKDIVEEIGLNVVKLKSLSAKDAVELVRSRLDGNEEFISDDMIQAVYEVSNENTRRFLENLEDVSRHAVEAQRESVSKEDLKVVGAKAPAAKKAPVKKVDTVLKHFGLERNEENREQLKEIGLEWKRDDEWKPHNRENFYAYVEKTGALRALK
jgi:replication-associated recombination protein RarA